ncbi:acyltransferase family protein [Pontibacter fetidus]|uniref:Acyltransferase n=1 Tax=Pontibacter fetidus TaxID=2700082 RepID=A0A6B2H9X0_9BACT|nr:acyltransferase [Pontibacter fetidus]NDK56362.1 acyltransferase [Pontibacter fetidus]
MISDEWLKLKLRLLSLIAMIMVVFVHAYTFDLNGYAGAMAMHKNYNSFFQDFISQGVARVASPLFFIISGFLLFARFKLTTAVITYKYRKRIQTMLIPFLLWSVYGIVLYFVLQLIPFLKPHFTHHIISDMSFRQWVITLFIEPIPYQLWFMRDLMMLVLLCPVVWLLVRYLKLLFLVPLLICWVLDLDFIIFTSGSLFFFAVGCYLAKLPESLNVKLTKIPFQIPLVNWLGMVLFRTQLNFINYPNTMLLMLLHKLAILVGIFAIWLTVSSYIDATGFDSRKWLTTSVSPFFIYTFHEPLLSFIKKGLLLFIPVQQQATVLLVYLLAPILTILLAILVSRVVRQYAPALFHSLTGYRDLAKPLSVSVPVTGSKTHPQPQVNALLNENV